GFGQPDVEQRSSALAPTSEALLVFFALGLPLASASARRRCALLIRTCLPVSKLVASHPPCRFSLSMRTVTSLSLTLAMYLPPIFTSSFFMGLLLWSQLLRTMVT